MLDRCSEQKPAAKELPEYLKQRLRARDILGDNSCTAELVSILSYINIIFFLIFSYVEVRMTIYFRGFIHNFVLQISSAV